MTPLIQTRGLVKHFAARGFFRRPRPVQAVAGVDLHVNRGEALGLVGESGSGKSTLGRLVMGLIPATAGETRLDGRALDALPKNELRRRTGIVFQDPMSSLDPRRRVGSQVADGLAIHNLAPASARPERAGALLERVGLSATFATRFPHELSGGQRQRIGLARALATEPEFLVADEPVSALDVSIQAQVLALLRDLRAQLGLAMLFISHDLPVVRGLCDRVAVMYLGRVVEEGPVADVFATPLHPYTEALLSAAPRLRPEARQARIVLQGDPPSPANPPSGCTFRTRCRYALPACAAQVPPLDARVRGAHRAACIRDELGLGGS